LLGRLVSFACSIYQNKKTRSDLDAAYICIVSIVRVGIKNSLGVLSSLFSTRQLVQGAQLPFLLPFYHAVSNESLPHVQHLYPVKTEKAFIEDLDYLLEHFTPIDYFNFASLSEEKQNIDKPYLLLSFDDGLKSVYETIAPILTKKGIPAMFFLNSAFIDNQALFYRYKVSLLIDQLKKEPQFSSAITDHFKSSIPAKKLLLNLGYHQTKDIDALALKLSVDFTAYLEKEQPYLTSNQISELISKGFHFGGHSIDHPLYSELDEKQQIHQTSNSCLDVSNRFNLKYQIFSFPFTDHGVSQSFFTRLQNNKDIAASFGCAGVKEEPVQFHWQRLAMEDGHSSGSEIIKTELLSYIIKRSLGLSKVKRD